MSRFFCSRSELNSFCSKIFPKKELQGSRQNGHNRQEIEQTYPQNWTYWIEMDRMNKIEKMDRNGPK